jgi:hypothetical protein
MRELTVPAFESPAPRPAAKPPAAAGVGQQSPPGIWSPYPPPVGYPGYWGMPVDRPNPATVPMIPGRGPGSLPEGDRWTPEPQASQEPPSKPAKKLTPEEEKIERQVADFRKLLVRNPQVGNVLDKIPLDQLGTALNNPDLQKLISSVPLDQVQGMLKDPSKAQGFLVKAAEDMVTPYVPKFLRRPVHSIFSKVGQA